MAFVTTCATHGVFLLDECSVCKKRVRIWQESTADRAASFKLSSSCFSCMSHICEMPTEIAKQQSVCAQRTMLRALEDGRQLKIGLLSFEPKAGFEFLRAAIVAASPTGRTGPEMMRLAKRRKFIEPWEILLAGGCGE